MHHASHNWFQLGMRISSPILTRGYTLGKKAVPGGAKILSDQGNRLDQQGSPA